MKTSCGEFPALALSAGGWFAVLIWFLLISMVTSGPVPNSGLVKFKPTFLV